MTFDEVWGDNAVGVEQEEDVCFGVSCTHVPGPTGSESVVILKVVMDIEPIDRLDHATDVLFGPVIAYMNLEG
jgi:hypothetical protein